ncbi:MAG TPA: protein kinase [Polyangiaceae bacterium]
MPAAQPHEDLPTVAEPATASARTLSSGTVPPASGREGPASGGASGGTSATALVALHGEEAARTSSFGRAMALIAGCGLLVHLTLYHGGVPILRHGMTASLVVMVIAGLAVSRVARDPARYTTRVTIVFGMVALSTMFVVELYLGVYSPFPCIVALGLSIFGLVDETRVVVPLCIAACATYFVVASLIAFGVMDDPGLFAPAHPTRGERMGMVTMVMAVYAAALWQARMSRRATREAIERSNRAVLSAQQREALLAEAHRQIDAALQAGAGKHGRWTGSTVGSFQLGSVVGRGAMGEVYAAVHVTTGAPAAVKLLHPRVLADGSIVKRFLREAEIASKLRVPNVVELLETGLGADGAPYLAMELLEGHDLAWHLRQRRRLPLAETVAMVEQIAQGLQAAHEVGIVHRDLKPQNLLLHERPRAPVWKILDFGVSKLRHDGGAPGGTLTEGGAILGTPGYIAPEQLRTGSTDARADLFALGAVTYRALTGQPAFSGSDMKVLFEVVYKQPTAPSDLVPSLPRDVDRVLAIALAKRPEDRFGEALELAEALRAASRAELPPALSARADALTSALPWGKTR